MSTTLAVSQPCQQSWAAMTPTAAGRHCAACQTVVVDFTHKTDGEILAYLARASHACGRFRADQLGRPLLPPAAPSRWRSWLASVLALGGVLGSGRAAAQGGGNFHPGPMPATVQPAAAPAPEEVKLVAPPVPSKLTSDESLLVRGKVVDSQGQGLPGVTVLLQGTTLGMSTNVTGDFELTLPATAVQDSLLFSYVGYAPRHLPVPASPAAPLVVQLQEDTHMLGLIVAGYYGISRKPWPWHPRALYYRAKYLLLHPFRQ